MICVLCGVTIVFFGGDGEPTALNFDYGNWMYELELFIRIDELTNEFDNIYVRMRICRVSWNNKHRTNKFHVRDIYIYIFIFLAQTMFTINSIQTQKNYFVSSLLH